ncbi:MAG: hypothetical protein NTV79_06375 [Candidatus Aureabacteria bacterium]|nr:hypothetical protein [Candidatus Auribacterota bacterium]
MSGIVAIAALIISGCGRDQSGGTAERDRTGPKATVAAISSPAAKVDHPPEAPGGGSGKARFWKTLDY